MAAAEVSVQISRGSGMDAGDTSSRWCLLRCTHEHHRHRRGPVGQGRGAPRPRVPEERQGARGVGAGGAIDNVEQRIADGIHKKIEARDAGNFPELARCRADNGTCVTQFT